MSFKIMALAPQIYVRDAKGGTICYVKQKLLKLKEAVTVFVDETKSRVLCEIKADRIIDWSANYHFYDTGGESFGSVRRKGMRSIWKAHYEVYDENGQHSATIQEENPMAKIADGIFGEIPVLGIFSGYVFHPKYLVTSPGGEQKLRLTKKPAMLEGKYSIDKLTEMDEVEELRCLMAILMMSLLERARG
jgi:uncharacterized protein YxjI